MPGLLVSPSILIVMIRTNHVIYNTHVVMDSSRDVPVQREYFTHESLIQWVTAEGESSWMPSFGDNFFVSIVKTEFAIRADVSWMSVSGFCKRERALTALHALCPLNYLVDPYCYWGYRCLYSLYVKFRKFWVLTKPSWHEFTAELSHDRCQLYHRCASTSSLVLLATVVELFLERLLPSGDQERWPMSSLPLLHGWGF